MNDEILKSLNYIKNDMYAYRSKKGLNIDKVDEKVSHWILGIDVLINETQHKGELSQE